ncbi:hypothetical protein BDW59DRAFT_137406 [Aspergillus cavernicola]|uniref:Secreted protein n=1 Tax=Aspergillus cavernicola TaxID=176166 RepID=A0ABR4J891_9EURO
MLIVAFFLFGFHPPDFSVLIQGLFFFVTATLSLDRPYHTTHAVRISFLAKGCCLSYHCSPGEMFHTLDLHF